MEYLTLVVIMSISLVFTLVGCYVINTAVNTNDTQNIFKENINVKCSEDFKITKDVTYNNKDEWGTFRIYVDTDIKCYTYNIYRR